MDRRHLTVVREVNPLRLLVPREAEAVLLVEQEGDDRAEVRDRVQRLVDEICHQQRRPSASVQAFDPRGDGFLLAVGRRAQPASTASRGPAGRVPVVEDMAVPPEVLPEFLVRMQNVLKRHQVTASIFCHAGHGQVHIRPFLDLADPGRRGTMRGGRRSVPGGLRRGRHDRRRARLRAGPHAYLAAPVRPLYGVFRRVKQIFDPANS